LNPLIAFPIYAVAGLWIVLYGRSSYSKPLANMRRSIPLLPRRPWAVKLFRCLTVIWIFAGFMIVAQGVATLPVIGDHRGLRLLGFGIGLAAAATALVVRFTRHEDEGISAVGHSQ
jgi:hypothetical protein